VKTFGLVFTGIILALIVTAQTTGQKTSVAGKWHFVFQTEDGERTADPTFEQDGEKVGGKWGNAAVKGTFTQGKLDLAFPYDSDEAGPGTLKIKGEVKEDTLAGRWEFQQYSGTFTATRTR
jgi:hypothetical protein